MADFVAFMPNQTGKTHEYYERTIARPMEEYWPAFKEFSDENAPPKKAKKPVDPTVALQKAVEKCNKSIDENPENSTEMLNSMQNALSALPPAALNGGYHTNTNPPPSDTAAEIEEAVQGKVEEVVQERVQEAVQEAVEQVKQKVETVATKKRKHVDQVYADFVQLASQRDLDADICHTVEELYKAGKE